MSKTRYPKELRIQVTEEMYQFVDLLAARQRTTKTTVVRQAIRDHLDVQEDVIGSRSRLGARVMSRLGAMQHRFLRQLVHLGKLLLAAVIILLSEQGADVKEAIARIADLAAGPELNKLVRLEEE